MQGDELVPGPLSRQQESRLPRQNFPLNLPTNRRLCSTVGGRIVEGWAAHCCAVSAARSRAATMTNLARSSLALVLPGRVCSTGRGFRSRRACLLLFTRIVSRVDVIDRPRPNAMDLKDGLFLASGAVVHLGLHKRHAAGRYSLGLGGIKLVSHADVKGAGDHSYVLDRGVRVRWNFVVRRKPNAEGERHCLIQRSLNDGNLRARWQRRHVSPFKIRGRNKRVSLSRICWRDQEDAKSAQKSGCYCNGFHSFLLRWVSEILRTHGRLQARPASGGLKIMLRSA